MSALSLSSVICAFLSGSPPRASTLASSLYTLPTPLPASCSLKHEHRHTLAAIAIDTLRQGADINITENEYGDIVHDAPISGDIRRINPSVFFGRHDTAKISRSTPWRGFPILFTPEPRLANTTPFVVSDIILDIFHRLIAWGFRLSLIVDISCSGVQRGDAFHSSSQKLGSSSVCIDWVARTHSFESLIPRGNFSFSCARPLQNTTTLWARQKSNT